MATSKSTTGEKSPAFQFYPKDFISSTKVQRMSLTEIGAYTLLLSHCWLDSGLPSDIAQLARIVKVKDRQFARMWKGALSECFYEKQGKLQNDRLDKERKKQAEYRRRQTDAAHARWDKPKASHGNATALPRESREDALLSPISDLQPTVTTTKNVVVRPSRPQPLVTRRRLDAAWEGPRVYVPQRVHTDFKALRNHPDAEPELLTWYARVSEEWTDGARRSESPGADMIRFWKARYDEEWPAAAAATSPRMPAWMR
jgi:uncharacterized protein YdaU (DUF1376 family)